MLYAAPLVLVYVAALILAIAFWGDYPQTCAKVLAASLILLLTTLIQPVLQQQMIQSMRGAGGTAVSIGQSMSILALVANFFRAIGFGLLTWSAFAGRAPASSSQGFSVLQPPPPPRIPGS